MCTICGCGGGIARIGHLAARPAARPTLQWKAHVGAQGGDEADAVHVDVAPGAGQFESAAAERARREQGRLVRIEQDILGKNDLLAGANRRWLEARGIFALNLVSSPGSGKTALLCRTIASLKARLPIAVIEGDQQTDFDAERIRASGARALQINTGKGCHLDAQMVKQALERLDPVGASLLLIENVGNLVCPAAFDLGEAHKVVILSVTEGEDKPLKYPDMFAAADLMILNKIDLLPHLEFDVAKTIEYARRINPGIEVLLLSATSGEGFVAWLAWLEARHAAVGGARTRALDQAMATVADVAEAPR